MAPFLFYASLSLLLFVAVLLILLVLIQKGRGGGLSSAFGGSGGSTAFGAKTGDVLTWATSIVFGVFILLAVVLDLVVNHQYSTKLADTQATTSTTATGTTAMPVIPAGPSKSEQIQQTLDSMRNAAVPTTLPTTVPAGLTIPHLPVEATTLPSIPALNVPSLNVPTLAVPTTLPAVPTTMPAVPSIPGLPAATQPH